MSDLWYVARCFSLVLLFSCSGAFGELIYGLRGCKMQNLEEMLKRYLAGKSLEYNQEYENARADKRYLDKLVAEAKRQCYADMLGFVIETYKKLRGEEKHG